MINRGEGGDSQLFAEGLKSPMERLNDAFQKRSSEENQWARTQERLLLQMSSIGVSTLNVVTQGFSTITTILMALVPGSSTTFGDAQRASVQFHTVQDKFLSSLSKNLRGMMGAGATGLGVEMPDFLKRHEKEKQDQAAKSRERNEKENYHFRRDFQKVQNIIGQMGGSENLSDLQQKRLRSEILQRRKKAQESGRAVDVALATEQGVKAAGIPYEKDGLRIRLVVERSDKRGEDMF